MDRNPSRSVTVVNTHPIVDRTTYNCRAISALRTGGSCGISNTVRHISHRDLNL